MLALGHMVLGNLGLISFKLIVNWNALQVAILASEPICPDRKRNDMNTRYPNNYKRENKNKSKTEVISMRATLCGQSRSIQNHWLKVSCSQSLLYSGNVWYGNVLWCRPTDAILLIVSILMKHCAQF